MTTRKKGRTGLTLIELVMTVAVMAILAAILLPVVSAVRQHARRASARNEVKNLETAWNRYYGEYNVWPTQFEQNVCYAMTNALAEMLQGESVEGMNTSRIPLMRFNRFNAERDAVNPWGDRNADSAETPFVHFYYARFDTDYDNTIPAGASPPLDGPAHELRRRVIVWTYDPRVSSNDSNYVIGSWQ